MTKRQLLKALEGVPDNAEVFINQVNKEFDFALTESAIYQEVKFSAEDMPPAHDYVFVLTDEPIYQRTVGHVYYIEGYTAPKVFTGARFICLLTDQVISWHNTPTKDLGHVRDWQTEIFQPERFKELLTP